MAGYIQKWFTCLQAVIHSSTNPALIITLIICPIAIAQYATDYRMTFIFLFVSTAMAAIFMKLSTVIRGPKSKIECVLGVNSDPFPYFATIFPPIMHIQSASSFRWLLGCRSCIKI